MKLFDVCEINPRQQGISDDTLVSFVAMPDVSEDGKIKTNVIRPFSEVKKGYTVFQEGDILFAKITPCMENGKGALATGLKNGIGVGSTEFHVLRPNPGYVDRMWVYYLTAWPAFRREAESHMTGSAGQRRVPKSFLEEYSLSVPSLKTQHEQVEHLNRINKVIEARKEQLCIFDDLIKARFVEMFGLYPDNPMGWRTGVIRDVVSDVRYGSSRPAVEGGRYPYLRMNNITYGGELDLTDTKRIDVPENELDKCTVCRGDVLFNRTNSKELVGKTCVYNRDEMMVLAGFVIRIRLNDTMLPEFLSAFLNTDFSKQMLLGMCKTAIGQANINAQEMQGIGLYIPPIELQKEYVAFKAQVDKSKVVDLSAFTNRTKSYII